MIDNFELIKSLLSFNSDDVYYHLQIIRRGKDNPELPAANRVIKSYFICKLESLDYIKEEVKNLCKYFNARAYINISPKSIRKTTLLQLKYIAQRQYEEDFKKIWRSWNTCVGIINGEEPRWIIDIDDNTKDSKEISNFINTLYPIVDNKYIAKIPTKNGYHLITTSFDIKKFKEKYPDIDVHKNNPTILYIP